MNKKSISIILNLLIVILEIIALFMTINYHHRYPIEYYTEDSNLLLLISSFLFLISSLLNKKIPTYLKMLKYLSTIGVTLTFLVVIFVLAPMYNFDYYSLLIKDSLIFVHLMCPLLGMITFIHFDQLGSFTLKDNVYGITLTSIYAFIVIVLNVFNILEGPYPFLMVHNQSLLVSIIWFIVIILLTYLIGYVLRQRYMKGRKYEKETRIN